MEGCTTGLTTSQYRESCAAFRFCSLPVHSVLQMFNVPSLAIQPFTERRTILPAAGWKESVWIGAELAIGKCAGDVRELKEEVTVWYHLRCREQSSSFMKLPQQRSFTNVNIWSKAGAIGHLDLSRRTKINKKRCCHEAHSVQADIAQLAQSSM